MIKVAYLVHSAAPSGAELALLRALRAWPEDQQVTVIFGGDGHLVEQYRAAGINVELLPLPASGRSTRRGGGAFAIVRTIFSLVGYSIELRRFLRQLDPDVLVAGSLRAVIYARLASWGTRVPFVWSVHDRLEADYLGRASPFFSSLMPWSVDALIVNSHSTRSSIRSRAKRPVLVCPPGISRRSIVRRELAPVRRFAILGRLAPWKGQDVGINAYAQADLPDGSELHIIGGALFGETAFEESLRSTVAERGLSDQVTFHGHVENPSELLDEVDVLMHTSVVPEPFGSVVLEGLDSGCIVVATTPGGPAEVITPGTNGFLVPAGDVHSLCAALRDLASIDSTARADLIARGHETVERFDIAETTRARAGFIRAVASGERLPDIIEWSEWGGSDARGMAGA